MSIEAEAESDLVIESEDGENVSGGKTSKKAGRKPEAEPHETKHPVERSLEGLEGH